MEDDLFNKKLRKTKAWGQEKVLHFREKDTSSIVFIENENITYTDIFDDKGMCFLLDGKPFLYLWDYTIKN